MHCRIRTGFVSSFIYSGLIVSAFYSSPRLNSSRGNPVVFFVDTKLSQYFSQLLKLVLGNRFARVHTVMLWKMGSVLVGCATFEYPKL